MANLYPSVRRRDNHVTNTIKITKYTADTRLGYAIPLKARVKPTKKLPTIRRSVVSCVFFRCSWCVVDCNSSSCCWDKSLRHNNNVKREAVNTTISGQMLRKMLIISFGSNLEKINTCLVWSQEMKYYCLHTMNY